MVKKINPKAVTVSSNSVATIEEQDATLTAIASKDDATNDDANALVTVTLSNAHKTPTAIILKKGSVDSVDGKERWFAKKDLNAFKIADGKWQITAPKKYFVGKLIAHTDAE